MNRANRETVTTFAEVLSTAGLGCHQAGRPATPDSRPMIYFQGMKVYIPDSFQPETLLKQPALFRQFCRPWQVTVVGASKDGVL